MYFSNFNWENESDQPSNAFGYLNESNFINFLIYYRRFRNKTKLLHIQAWRMIKIRSDVTYILCAIFAQCLYLYSDNAETESYSQKFSCSQISFWYIDIAH